MRNEKAKKELAYLTNRPVPDLYHRKRTTPFQSQSGKNGLNFDHQAIRLKWRQWNKIHIRFLFNGMFNTFVLNCWTFSEAPDH
jgi:hypothetical protein